MEKAAIHFKFYVTDSFGIFLDYIWFICCKKSWKHWLEAILYALRRQDNFQLVLSHFMQKVS